MFTSASFFLFSHAAFRLMLLNNVQLARNLFIRSKISAFFANVLITLESLVCDVHVDFDIHRLFSLPLVSLRIDNFQNDEHYENWTRFNKSELFDLV